MMNDRKPRDSRELFEPGKRLTGYTKIRFTIRSEEGLSIHGNESGLEIGSIVEPNLRAIVQPRTRYPYIPGSSLKGKLRSTLEKFLGRYDARTGQACSCGEAGCLVCVIFGAANPGKRHLKSAPTRIVVRDASLTEKSKAQWDEAVKGQKPAFEHKTESFSNRALGSAQNPRTLERVPPGTEFAGEIVLREFDDEDGAKFVETIKKIMAWIEEADGIGSGVSRGSGKVGFHVIDITSQQAPSFQ